MADILTFSNFARCTLSSAVSDTDTAVILSDPDIFSDGTFTAVIWSAGMPSPVDDPHREIVTAVKSGGVFTISRAQESTTASSWPAGSSFANVLTASAMNRTQKHVTAQDTLITVRDAEYSVGLTDRNIIFLCEEDVKTITATMPDAALCAGVSFTMTNGSVDYSSAVTLVTSGNMSLYAGSTVRMTSDGTAWIVTDIIKGQGRDVYPNMPDGGGISSSTAYAYIGFGIGTANIYTAILGAEIYPLVSDGMHGIPLTIVKMEDDYNPIYVITDYSDFSSVNLFTAGDSVTIISDASGNIKVTAVHRSDAGRVKAVTYSEYLIGAEEYLLADATEDEFELDLPYFGDMQGRTITVKKTDSTANTVLVALYNPDGYEEYTLTLSAPLIQFISDGEKWHRLV